MSGLGILGREMEFFRKNSSEKRLASREEKSWVATMSQSDFKYIPVNHSFDAGSPVFEHAFSVTVGAGETLAGGGYLLITARSVGLTSHTIQINGTDLSGLDIPLPPGGSNAWLTYMDRIEPDVLLPGTNNIQITRIGDDDFKVRDIVIHWRKV